MKAIASSSASVKRAGGFHASRRAKARAIRCSAIAATLAFTAVAISLRLSDEAEGLLPPATVQETLARGPGSDRVDAVAPEAEVASGPVRVDSPGPAARADAPATLPLGIGGRLCTSDGQAVPNSHVFLVARDHGQRQHTFTGPDGRFEFTAGAGPHTLVVPPFARLPGFEQEVELRHGAPRIEIAMPRLATAALEGHIVDTDGIPLSGTRAVLRTSSSPGAADFVETDRGGWFRLADIPVGDLVLRTSEPIRAEVRGHVLTAGPTRMLQFVLDIGCHFVAGRVIVEGGTPAVGAHVRLDRSCASGNGIRCVSTRTLVTNQNGWFAFEHIGPGSSSLTVMASGCATEIVDVEADSSTVVAVHRIAN